MLEGEGEVVRLDSLDLAHVDELVAAATERRSSYGFTLVPLNPPSMRAYVAAALDDERLGWSLPFVIRVSATGRIVGSSRFLDLDYWEVASGLAAREAISGWRRDSEPSPRCRGSSGGDRSHERGRGQTERRVLRSQRGYAGRIGSGFRQCNLFSQVIALGNTPPTEESDGVDLRAGEPQQPSP